MGAARFVKAEGDDPEMRAHLAQAMAKEDPEAALAYAKSYPGRTDTAIQGVMREWAKTDPSAVAQQMDKVSHYYREDVWHEVLETWFKGSPEQAAEYVRGVPLEEAEWDWESLYSSWREADLDGLASYVASLPGDHPTEMLTEAVAEQYVTEDRLDDGATWFGQLDAAHQEKALVYLLDAILPMDVGRAEALARQSQHAEGLVKFAEMYAYRDLEAAVKWGGSRRRRARAFVAPDASRRAAAREEGPIQRALGALVLASRRGCGKRALMHIMTVAFTQLPPEEWAIVGGAVLVAAIVGFLLGRRRKPAPEPVTSAPLPTPASSGPRAEAEVVSFLALMQEKGRLVDFLMDDVTSYNDAEVGAAARVVHQGCQSVLKSHLAVEPISGETEGARVSLPEGYDAADFRLLGNVAGEPPYEGTLVHKGWRVTSVTLPQSVGGDDALPNIAAAQVELS